MLRFSIVLIASLLVSCDNKNTSDSFFKLQLSQPKPSYATGEILSVKIENLQKKQVDSAVIFIDQMRLGKANPGLQFEVSLEGQKVGLRKLHTTVYFGKKTETTHQDVLVLAGEAPKLYTYKILNEYPHDINAYTQGLEFYKDTLYESTGEYGKSSLRKTDYKTGKVFQKVDLEKTYFGEGITILNDKIYQLTWKENVGFIYNTENLEKTGNFMYSKSKEGWGLCNNGKTIYKSDGTEKIWILNPVNLSEESYLEIYTNTSRINSVNELEWVDGKIYANIYEKNAIAIINPKTGAAEGVIDLNDLQQKVTQHQFLNVLNGIAYKGEPNKLFVTGKNWDKLFEIEIIEKQ